jgi:hypothetical protein
MKIDLRTIVIAPAGLPIWPRILDDLGNPPPRRIAKTLGVSVRTVRRWNAAQSAPRSACLALFWMDGLKFGLPDVALGVTPAAALGPLPVVEDVSASFDEIGVGEPAASTAKKMVEATDAVHTSALGKSPAAVFIAALAEVLHEVL